MSATFDPQLVSLAIGVLANCLTGLAGQVWQKSRNLFGRDDVRTVLAQDRDLAGTLSAAFMNVARRLPSQNPESDLLKYFLASPDAEAIVRQLYSTHLSSIQRHSSLDSIQAEFSAALRRFLRDASLADELAPGLFTALTRATSRALEIAVQKGSLAAHDAQSAFRHRLILDELLTIEKNLAFLQRAGQPDLRLIDEFEGTYRQQVRERHAFIIPPHFDAARKIPIDDLYVTPDVIRLAIKKGEEPRRLGAPDFLAQVYRAVLLGNPGGGKSTFAQKLCWDLTQAGEVRLLANRVITPILVVLREYGAEKKARQVSILQFIEETANSKYQIKPPAGAFEHLILNGRSLIIFDGLDELLETKLGSS